MSISPPTLITAKDYRALEQLLVSDQPLDEWVARAVRQKLRQSQVMFGSDIPANVITIGTRFLFEVADLAPEQRVLVRDCDDYPQGTALGLATARGVALLGLAEGAEVNVQLADRAERIGVHSVLFQPEANVNHVHLMCAEDAQAHEKGRARITRLNTRPVGAPYWDGDDPGPRAA